MTIPARSMRRMVARIFDPETKALILVCGPYWRSSCPMVADGVDRAFCAGRTVLIDRETPAGPKTLQVQIAPTQRTCPFGPPDLTPRRQS